MVSAHLQAVHKALKEAASRYEFILVPGLYDSGPEHWQSIWQTHFDFWQRITQKTWDNPDIGLWIDAIRRQLSTNRRPSILVGHSFGALASCCVTVGGGHDIAGLLLVAPAEPEKFEVAERVPAMPLRAPAIVVASHNDPLMRFGRAVYWSKVWNADIADLGEAGHINAEAGFGAWPYGLELLRHLVEIVDQQRSADR
jgi:hypothetical protein